MATTGRRTGYSLITHDGDSTAAGWPAPTTAAGVIRHRPPLPVLSCRTRQLSVRSVANLGVTVLVAEVAVLRAPAATDRLARSVEAALFLAGVPVPAQQWGRWQGPGRARARRP